MIKYNTFFKDLRLSLFVCVMMLLSLTSCKHNNITPVLGPAICPSPDFAFTQAFTTPSSVDFGAGSTVNFTAGFNEVTSWTIRVTGQTSGATISFSGKTTSINIIWKGNPGTLVFFQAEQATVELIIPCRETLVYALNILSKPRFNNFGVLLTDFDGNGVTTFNSAISSWGVISAAPQSPQGGSYFHADTANNTSGSYYYGGINGGMFSLSSLGTTNPDSVYFNVLLNSDGISTGNFYMIITANSLPYQASINPTAVGWKMYSLKLSDFKPSTAGPSANPMQVTQMRFELDALNAGSNARANIDFAIFTKGPFLP